jgi:membrane protease YdiL (CAAX protease family)
MAGLLLGFLLTQLIGVSNPLEALKDNSDLNLLVASRDLGLLLLCQYIGLMLPAFLIGWWHRRRPFERYGLTTAQRPLSYHLGAGLVLFAIAALPFRLLTLAGRLLPIGEMAYTQELAYSLNWADYRFWIFMAVGSFLLVPVLEELFHRGYVQTRLAEDFDAPTAILMSACLFVFSHRQYFDLSAWNLGMLVTSVWEAVTWGFVFYRTRSLVAVIVAHALVNIPVRGAADFILPVLMLAVIIAFRRPILHEARQAWSLLRAEVASWTATAVGCLSLALFMVAFAVAEELVVMAGALLLAVALVMEIVERRGLGRAGATQSSLQARLNSPAGGPDSGNTDRPLSLSNARGMDK